MKYPRTIIALGLFALLAAWVGIAGIEGERRVADLAPLPESAREGAVLVIGGTRGTGLEVVRVLRARGDDVVVLARESSDAGAAEALGARIVRGDALEPADLARAMAGGADGGVRAVISTLGGRSGDGPRPDFEGNRNAVDAARMAGIRRFVLVTVIGAGDSYGAAPWLSRRALGTIIVEKTKAEDYLRASGLDYTIIRPGGLLNGGAEGRAYLTADSRAMSWIRRADLARLAVRAADDEETVGRIYTAFDPDRTRFWSILANRAAP